MFVIIAQFQSGTSYWNATNSTWGSRRFATEYPTEDAARYARANDITRPVRRYHEVSIRLLRLRPLRGSRFTTN